MGTIYPGLIILVALAVAFLSPLLGAVLDTKRKNDNFHIQDTLILRLQADYRRKIEDSDDCEEKLRAANTLINLLIGKDRKDLGLNLNIIQTAQSDVGQSAAGRGIGQEKVE